MNGRTVIGRRLQVSGHFCRITVGCVLLAISSPFNLSAQSTALVDSFYAPSLGKTKKFTYLLPSPYQKSVKYPILYLLHGYGDDYLGWSTRTNISKYVGGMPLIVVMPDGENSWYVNSIGNFSARFEDYIAIDLLRYIQTHFSVDTTRQAIAGLSMGGNGSLVLAMRHPAQFKFAGSLSGAITVPHLNADTSSLAVKYLSESLLKAYGSQPSEFWDRHDVFHLFRPLAKSTAPYLYLVIGIQDEYRDFVTAHRQLIDSLRTSNIAYEYHEIPGNHSWAFWDREIQPLLKRMMEILVREHR